MILKLYVSTIFSSHVGIVEALLNTKELNERSISLAAAGDAGTMIIYSIVSSSAGVDVFGTTLVSHNKFVN